MVDELDAGRHVIAYEPGFAASVATSGWQKIESNAAFMQNMTPEQPRARTGEPTKEWVVREDGASLKLGVT
ncbi:hypothetical protein GX48_01984 [Paracoccidioides brasiliensis]|nr:hypothetical protein GX48_01984 [Paracoccidioides brasiliensis]